MVRISTGEGKVVSDEAGKEDPKWIIQELIQLFSEFGHHSKSNGKALKSFRKENNFFFVF